MHQESYMLTPTVKAARELAWQLPDPLSEKWMGFNGEANRFFHIRTEDYSILELIIKEACKERGLKSPLLFSIREFKDIVTDEHSKSINFEKLYDIGNDTYTGASPCSGNPIFVVQEFQSLNAYSENPYGGLLKDFQEYCSADRAYQLSSKKSGAWTPIRIYFVFYDMSIIIPPILKNRLHTISLESLCRQDYKYLIEEYRKRNADRIQAWGKRNGCKDAEINDAISETMSELQDNTLEWYENYMSGLSEMKVRRIFSELEQDFLKNSEIGKRIEEKYRDVNYLDLAKVEKRIVKIKNEVLSEHNRLEIIETKSKEKHSKQECNQIAHEVLTRNEIIEKKENNETVPLVGLDAVSTWLNNHKKVIKNERLHPTGILLVGIPGTGKSMTAKLAAKILDLPLVKLDMSKILGGYVGDSEKGMREMLEDLSFAAPSVLWIDEVEKALSGADGCRSSN